MQETVNGVKHEGDWEEVVEVTKKASAVVEDDDFNEWRPRDSDNMDEVRKRSAEKASSDDSELLEKIERAVYLGVMLKATPSYYDSKEVSANVNDKTMSDDYSVEIAVPEKEKRERLKRRVC